MADVKLTKSELRLQQTHLSALRKYLPMLQLKKSMLQVEVNKAREESLHSERAFADTRRRIEDFAELLSIPLSFDIFDSARPKEIRKRFENIAGIELPYFESIAFEEFHYTLFDTPPWLDGEIAALRSLIEAKAKVTIAREKVAILEKELREVSIKVNLFEKILIPRALKNIKKIKIFLGDQQLAAVSQAKVAKGKITKRKKSYQLEKGHAH